MPKESSQCVCLSVILVDSVLRTGNNYYPQVFLQECKYVVKEKKGVKVYYWQHRNFFWFWWRKLFFMIFFLYTKMTTNYYQKNIKKSFEKKPVRDIKNVQKLLEYRWKYYLTHKKYLLNHFIDFWGPETIKFIFGKMGVIHLFLLCTNEETLEFFS